MRVRKELLTGIALLLFACSSFPGDSSAQKPLYLDPAQPLERRVEDLLSRMTLKEKLGQMNMPCVYLAELGRDIPSKLENCKRFIQGTYTDEIGPGGGLFTASNEILREGPHQQ